MLMFGIVYVELNRINTSQCCIDFDFLLETLVLYQNRYCNINNETNVQQFISLKILDISFKQFQSLEPQHVSYFLCKRASYSGLLFD